MTDGRKRKNPTIEYLRRALRAEQRIKWLKQREARYRDTAIWASGERGTAQMGGAGKQSRVERGTIALADLAEEKRREADRYARAVSEIEGVIAQVDDDRYRDLLRWRYLNGLTWEQIAEELGLEVRWTHQLHGRALMEVDKIRGQDIEMHT